MLAFIGVLLAINVWAGSKAMRPAARVRVPYSPFFLQQVTAGNVTTISSKGTAIQGTFAKKQSYQGSKPTTLFTTEIPAFANTDALSQLLQTKRRRRQRAAARDERPVVGDPPRRVRPDDPASSVSSFS